MAQIVQSSSGKRQCLGEILPLQAPLSVHVFTSYFCDFRCEYCLQSLGDAEFKKIFKYKKFMTMQTLKNTVDGLKRFPNKLKVLCFDGQGEPLLNSKLPEMIAYAKEQGIAERIELVTNGNRLLPDVCDRLVAAGLDRIRISIQGLDAEKYKEVSDVVIDFEQFKKNIEYLYEHKKQLSIYIKIVDVALDGASEQVFYDMFGHMCDDIAVEHVVPTAEGVDYEQIKDDYQVGQQGYTRERIKCCPFPFYMLIVEPEGEVRACCATRHPVYYGNVNEMSIFDIWAGNNMQQFWKKQLSDKGRYAIAECKRCNNPDFGVQNGDNIDSYTDVISERLREKYGC